MRKQEKIRALLPVINFIEFFIFIYMYLFDSMKFETIDTYAEVISFLLRVTCVICERAINTDV